MQILYLYFFSGTGIFLFSISNIKYKTSFWFLEESGNVGKRRLPQIKGLFSTMRQRYQSN